jgi:mannose-6-phosphate isomerase-like protein (cupin superfamily)
MKSQNSTRTSGFVVAADEGPSYWFLNTLTITKVGSDHSHGQLSILDHRVPPGFAPPPHVHHHSDEALLVLDGQLDGFCGDHRWRAGPGSLVFMPRAVPHGFAVSDTGPGRIIIVASPVASTSSSRPPANQPRSCACPYPSRPTRLASCNWPPSTASRSCPRPNRNDPRASVCAAARGPTAARTAARRTPQQRTPVAASTAPRGQMTHGYRA